VPIAMNKEQSSMEELSMNDHLFNVDNEEPVTLWQLRRNARRVSDILLQVVHVMLYVERLTGNDADHILSLLTHAIIQLNDEHSVLQDIFQDLDIHEIFTENLHAPIHDEWGQGRMQQLEDLKESIIDIHHGVVNEYKTYYDIQHADYNLIIHIY
jgi:hypothetical protein